MTTTAIELGWDGSRTVFHCRGLRAWTHPEGEPYMDDIEGARMVKKPCPVCPSGTRSKTRSKTRSGTRVVPQVAPAVTQSGPEVAKLDTPARAAG